VSQEILQFLSVDVAGIDDLLGHLKGSVREYTAGQSVGLDLIIMKVGELGIRFGMEANVL
jgi:Holliday junction resolvasome RuvABC ATP-dependent DNA helicase subunit